MGYFVIHPIRFDNILVFYFWTECIMRLCQNLRILLQKLNNNKDDRETINSPKGVIRESSAICGEFSGYLWSIYFKAWVDFDFVYKIIFFVYL
ncbi:hypothetical protein DPV73_03740 [Leptospira mayottensis]|nr:hypothetical protein DPV73_03740 [Leptospira mayottensis]